MAYSSLLIWPTHSNLSISIFFDNAWSLKTLFLLAKGSLVVIHRQKNWPWEITVSSSNKHRPSLSGKVWHFYLQMCHYHSRGILGTMLIKFTKYSPSGFHGFPKILLVLPNDPKERSWPFCTHRSLFDCRNTFLLFMKIIFSFIHKSPFHV